MKFSIRNQRSGSPVIPILQRPVFLLLVTGVLIGFNFPLGKLGSMAGISPIVWSLLVSLGASGTQLPLLLLKGRLDIPSGRTIRYVMITGIISFVIPNLLLFSVIPRVGSGYAGLMFALSPIFTLFFAFLFGLRGSKMMGIVGIIFGLIGASVVTVTRGTVPDAPHMTWILAALLIPVTLACGNVYRTLDWPRDALPDVLAFWSHLVAIIIYLALLLLQTGNASLAGLASVPIVATAQLLVAGAAFAVFFRLQQYGGPVLLSQIGYLAAMVGLVAATMILGEHYSMATWTGAFIIGIGIAITIVSQVRDI